MNLSKPKSDSIEMSDLETILHLKLKVGELNQKLEEANQLVIKKDGHIEALENNLRQAQKDHIIELETMKDSFKSELSRMHELWAKSMNDRMDEKIEFHLEQQSEKFERKFEEIDNTTSNIEDRIDNVEEKVDNVEENVDKKVHNVEEKFDEKVSRLDEIDKIPQINLDELFTNSSKSNPDFDDEATVLKKSRFNDYRHG
eukprot:TRINITY_DN5486_c0_g2_i1.p1 TRINITY_DN5486_c0_g2~~TRINITY_DN5486_c0_g2_i1.p1  ORF type:complete len:200 (-),score=56.81 TRINITY_DN5486_c0_g2_i1:189-788(-)